VVTRCKPGGPIPAGGRLLGCGYVILVLKLLLAPALVVGCSLAGRRWGQRVAGTLAALPIVAGPILAVAALEHGDAFGARAASAALLGVVTLAVFLTTLAVVCRSMRWTVALPVGWLVCLAADVAVSRLSTSPEVGLVAAVPALLGAARVLGVIERRLGGVERAPAVLRMPWWDLPARALATVVLVLTVTGVAGVVGPRLSGVLAPFPIGLSVVAAFALAQAGPPSAVALLRGACRGLLGFAVFCYLVAVLLPRWGVVPAYAVAAVGSVLVQLALQVRPVPVRDQVTSPRR
jgi:hypothetical protein